MTDSARRAEPLRESVETWVTAGRRRAVAVPAAGAGRAVPAASVLAQAGGSTTRPAMQTYRAAGPQESLQRPARVGRLRLSDHAARSTSPAKGRDRSPMVHPDFARGSDSSRASPQGADVLLNVPVIASSECD